MISRRLRQHIRRHERVMGTKPPATSGLAWSVDESIDPATAGPDHFGRDFEPHPRPEEAGLLYFDLETTGLGATKRIFMAGFLFWEGSSLRLVQDIAHDPAEEAILMTRALERVDGATGIVTYNGRSFDMPFFRRRLSYHRRGVLTDEVDVVDLLHPARRQFKGRFPNCRLSTIENEVLGKERTSEDVPGAEAPLRFLDYVETGKRAYLEPVLYHNRIDLTSMVALRRILADGV